VNLPLLGKLNKQMHLLQLRQERDNTPRIHKDRSAVIMTVRREPSVMSGMNVSSDHRVMHRKRNAARAKKHSMK
jgi:hypothetical protein